jgi:hypothetical protein
MALLLAEEKLDMIHDPNDNLLQYAELDLSAGQLAAIGAAVHQGHPSAFAVIRGAAERRESPGHVRARVISLARCLADPELEPWLLDRLARDDEAVVQFRVCEALTHVGSEASLDALNTVALSGPAALRSIAAFAHVVVAHRHRRTSPHLALPSPSQRLAVHGEASSFESRPLDPASIGRIVRDLDSSARRLAPYLPVGVQIRCATNTWAFVRHDLGGTTVIDTLVRSGPCVLGVVAQLDHEHDRWAWSRIVLAGPLSGDEMYVCVYRRDGVVDLSGVGRSGAAFHLSSAMRMGAVGISAVGYWYDDVGVLAGIASTQRTLRRHCLRVSSDHSAGE